MDTRKIIWEPTGDYLNHSNVRRFMDRHGIADPRELVRRSARDFEWFWEAALEDLGIEWYRKYDRLLDLSGGFPWAKWFLGGEINIAHNCLDRHARGERRDRTAFLWEGDDGAVRAFTYGEMSAEVARLANAMRDRGLGPGDAAGIYMPMVPETVFAMFACFQIGVAAVPIFSAFGAGSLSARLRDARARLLFTADYGLRRGKAAPIKPRADEAVAEADCVEHVVVWSREGKPLDRTSDRQVSWEAFVSGQPDTCETLPLPAESTSLILYTSGTTGRPKGTVHTHAGCLAEMTHNVCYGLDLRDADVFFWFTDIGWMMGPWEMIGVQCRGGTYLIYEGVPNHPQPDRLWRVLARHGVTILGISPTAIRLLKNAGDEWVERHDLSRLRVLGSTGEPWDPDSYMWYFEKVGGGRCPVINCSGGTELVGCLLTPLVVSPIKPCSLGGPCLGKDVDVFDDDGRPVRGGIGHLVCKTPSPSMTKGFLNDPERYLETYFSRWPGVWYHGDWAMVDEDGFWYLFGRSDDTIMVAGKRVGPAEVESALLQNPAVVEAAAVGVPHDVKGEAIVCFAVLSPEAEPTEDLRSALHRQVVDLLGKSLAPQAVYFVDAIPKTRSAKILRGAIRRTFLGESVGDTSSVENPEAFAAIAQAR
ncbi:MAG: AMP-binding protein [Nitrospinota bacterium]